jgi:predicted DNA-binding protein (MmcQ/YjbR family)
MASRIDALVEELRAFGLSYPGAELRSPWPEHLDLAVDGKTFAFLPAPGQPFSLSVKLPFTGDEARALPWAAPTAYGLGRSGWVSAKPEGPPDIELLKSWIDESYRAVAKKSRIKQLVALGIEPPDPSQRIR